MKPTSSTALYYVCSLLVYNAWAVFGTYVLGHIDAQYQDCHSCQVELTLITSLVFLLIPAVLFALSLATWRAIVARDVLWSLSAIHVVVVASLHASILMLPNILGMPNLFSGLATDGIVLLYPLLVGFLLVQQMKHAKSNAHPAR